MGAFAIFGNPIKHSKSAEIYSFFAREISISEQYDLRLVSPLENFEHVLFNFFKLEGGLGANITVPFKSRAFFVCNKLTDRAHLVRVINTIKKEKSGDLLGDNTDGIGFISDLKRLNWVSVDNFFVSSRTQSKKINILLIGSGGAAQGILPMLLSIKDCQINVVNRSYCKAQDLVSLCHKMGYKNISCTPMHELLYDSRKYSLIVNATVCSMNHTVPNIPSFLITSITKCYDLFYEKQDTSFLVWCKHHGADFCADGLGMLVAQAAFSFFLWHNFMPSIDPTLSYIRSLM